MQQNYKLVGLLGGTFDPFHLGHLHLATELLAQLNLSEIQFIPCQYPPHRKTPQASALDRLTMIKLAIADQPKLRLNDIEMHLPQPSYTINTVKYLKSHSPMTTFCFILATDAFAQFNHWYQWQEILNYCHLIVVNRLGFSLPTVPWLTELLTHHEIKNSDELTKYTTGKIFFQSIAASAINATEVRKVLASGHYPADMLPTTVLNYIKQHQLY